MIIMEPREERKRKIGGDARELCWANFNTLFSWCCSEWKGVGPCYFHFAPLRVQRQASPRVSLRSSGPKLPYLATRGRSPRVVRLWHSTRGRNKMAEWIHRRVCCSIRSFGPIVSSDKSQPLSSFIFFPIRRKKCWSLIDENRRFSRVVLKHVQHQVIKFQNYSIAILLFIDTAGTSRLTGFY